MNILTGFAVINDRNGKRISYTYDVVNDEGDLLESNNKKSYIVLDESHKNTINELETLIVKRMNK